MKQLIILLISLCLFGCGEDIYPAAAVNNTTEDYVNITIKQGTNPTTNINNVPPGALSRFHKIYEGTTLVKGLPDRDSLTFEAQVNYKYYIVVSTRSSRINAYER